jgi:ankyrin repeat protein
MRLPVLMLCVSVWCMACSPTFPPVPAGPGAPDDTFPLLDRPICDDAVLSALRRFDAPALLTLAKAGARMSCGDEDLQTPLDVAVLRDNPAAVRALLEAGANPNLRWSDHGDRFPLQEAIEERQDQRSYIHRAEIVGLLIKYGADVNARWCGSRRSQPFGGLACTTATGTTPLIRAATLDQPDTVGLLLAAGADATVPDDNDTALDYSAGHSVFGLILMQREPGMVKGEQGAIEEFTRRNPPPYGRGASGHTLLTYAIERRRYGQLRLALGAGADPNLSSSGQGGDWTPIAHALRARWHSGVELLLARAADLNGRSCPRAETGRASNGCQRHNGLTPMMVAAATGDVRLMWMLRERGADEDAVDWLGRTAADHANATGAQNFFR